MDAAIYSTKDSIVTSTHHMVNMIILLPLSDSIMLVP